MFTNMKSKELALGVMGTVFCAILLTFLSYYDKIIQCFAVPVRIKTAAERVNSVKIINRRDWYQ